MPELPEVETVVRGLARRLIGRRVAAVDVLHPPSVLGSPQKPQTLIGRTIMQVFRRGKFIRVALDEGMSMAVHLRMTGWLGLLAAADNKKNPPSHVRVLFTLDKADVLIFRDVRTFGRVWCGSEDELQALPSLSKLGPEPLLIDAQTFTQRLRARQTALKALLLDQTFLSGVGNIYADEALYAAKLHPRTKSSLVKPAKARELHAAIQDVLRAAIKAGGSSVENFVNSDGEQGWFQRKLRAYGRGGEKCERCNHTMQRILVSQRATCFCPACQKMTTR
jgi:formamidopyrimidine-DNA glycosylase